MIGDILFGSYQFPKTFIVTDDSPEQESDAASIPMSVGSVVPTPKWKQRALTVSGELGSGLYNASGVQLVAPGDIQGEVDAIMSALNAATSTGLQPLTLPSFDRAVFAYPQKPKVTRIQSGGDRYRKIDIPFFCGDPRAFLGTPGNLCPDSDMKFLSTYWMLSNAALSFELGTSADGGNSVVSAVSGPTGFKFAQSAPIPVIPGQTYTISGFINATNVSSGHPVWEVSNTQGNAVIGASAAQQTPGVSGRVSQTFTVPAGVTSVNVLADTNNCTMGVSGNTIKFSEPRLEIGSTANAYTPDFLAPQNLVLTSLLTDTSAHVVNATSIGNTRSYPTILLIANSGSNVGLKGVTIVLTGPDNTVVTLTIPTSVTISNGQILLINCDPLRPSAYITPMYGPRSMIVVQTASGVQNPTFANSGTNGELFPYLDPGLSTVSFQATGAPAGGSVGYYGAVIFDSAVI